MKKRSRIAVMLAALTVICALVMPLVFSDTAAASGSSDPFAGMRTYPAGQYRVGWDFIEGEYVLLSTSDYAGYFAITTDSNGNDIIANDNFETNSIVTVRSGEYLKLNRCVAVYAPDFYSQYTIRTDNDGTMLRVGVGYDIMPGEYKLISTSEYQGYWCIYNDSRHTDIVDNDLFSNSAWVTVKSGQYIVLSRCHIQN